MNFKNVMSPLRQRGIAEDAGAKLTWLVAACLFHFGWNVLGYVMVALGGLEMLGSLLCLIRAAKEDREGA